MRRPWDCPRINDIGIRKEYKINNSQDSENSGLSKRRLVSECHPVKWRRLYQIYKNTFQLTDTWLSMEIEYMLISQINEGCVLHISGMMCQSILRLQGVHLSLPNAHDGFKDGRTWYEPQCRDPGVYLSPGQQQHPHPVCLLYVPGERPASSSRTFYYLWKSLRP